jgi:hypothetical protein
VEQRMNRTGDRWHNSLPVGPWSDEKGTRASLPATAQPLG